MKKLEEMTAKEIVDKFGFAYDETCIKLISGSNRDMLREFRVLNNNEEYLSKSPSKRIDQIMGIIEKYEDIINKEYLVAYLLYSHATQLQRKQRPKEEEKKTREAVDKLVQLLGKRNFNIAFEESATNEYNKITYKRIKVINSQELINSIKSNMPLNALFEPSKRQQKMLETVEQTIKLEDMLGILRLNDFKSVSKALYRKDFFEKFFEGLSFNCNRRFYDLNPDVEERTELGLDDEEINNITTDLLRKSLKYIDVDRLFLIWAYRYIELVEAGKEEVDEKKYSMIRTVANQIGKGTTVEIIDEKENKEKTVTQYSLTELMEDLQRYTERRFVKKSEISEARDAILSGEKSLGDVDKILVKFLKLNSEEMDLIIQKREDNISYLIETGKIANKEDFYATICKRGDCSNNLLILAIKKQIIRGQDLLYLYADGLVTLDNIQFFIEPEEDKKEEQRETFINKSDINSKIREFYAKITDKENKDRPKDLQRFYRIVDLYKSLNIKGKTREEIEKTTNDLIASFEDLDSNALQTLYQFGVIELKDAVSWGASIKQMLASGDIKPTDLKNLLNDKTIRLEDIKNVLREEEMSFIEKLDLIYSTFDGESKEEYRIRDELIQLLEISQEYRGKNRIQKGQTGETNENKAMRKEYILDPHARWKLISLLDRDYSRKCLPQGVTITDGHSVSILPNLGVVFIEKMLQKRFGRQVSSYGRASIIVQADFFFEHLYEIIAVDKKSINRQFLLETERKEQGLVTRITHHKNWGKHIMKYFNINERNSIYTKEEIEEIEKTVQIVENSRQERE